MLAARRLKWYIHMKEHPEEYVQLRTTMTGEIKVGDNKMRPKSSKWIDNMINEWERNEQMK